MAKIAPSDGLAVRGVRARPTADRTALTAATTSLPDGAVLASEPCPLPRDYESWLAEEKSAVSRELAASGLGDALDAKPASDIFARDDFDALHASAADGRCTMVRYASAHTPVTGFVVRPPRRAGQRHPAILWARGGNANLGAIDTAELIDFVRFARAAFVVLATDYRGAACGGGRDEFGGADVDDLLNLVPLARTFDDVDGDQLFFFGESRGGMEVYLALKKGAPVRAAAVRGGLIDLESAAAERPVMRDVYRANIPDFDRDPVVAMRRRSVVFWPGAIRVPVLLLQAREDARTNMQDSVRMDALLARQGTPHALVIYNHDDHELDLHREDELARVTSWFQGHAH